MRFSYPIYPVTDTKISGLSHERQMSELADTNVEFVQLREKRMSSREFYTDALASILIAHTAGIKVLINDRVDLALILGADGVHIGQDDLSPVDARRILGPDAIIGFSTHTIDQAIVALTLPVDYIAFGPVYGTTSKKGLDEKTGVTALSEVRKVVKGIPLVAIGGIDESNIDRVSAAGANASAVISSIFGKPRRISDNVRILEENWMHKNV